MYKLSDMTKEVPMELAKPPPEEKLREVAEKLTGLTPSERTLGQKIIDRIMAIVGRGRKEAAYLEGFDAQCSALGVDPELVKQAAIPWSKLLQGGKFLAKHPYYTGAGILGGGALTYRALTGGAREGGGAFEAPPQFQAGGYQGEPGGIAPQNYGGQFHRGGMPQETPAENPADKSTSTPVTINTAGGAAPFENSANEPVRELQYRDFSGQG